MALGWIVKVFKDKLSSTTLWWDQPTTMGLKCPLGHTSRYWVPSRLGREATTSQMMITSWTRTQNSIILTQCMVVPTSCKKEMGQRISWWLSKWVTSQLRSFLTQHEVWLETIWLLLATIKAIWSRPIGKTTPPWMANCQTMAKAMWLQRTSLTSCNRLCKCEKT